MNLTWKEWQEEIQRRDLYYEQVTKKVWKDAELIQLPGCSHGIVVSKSAGVIASARARDFVSPWGNAAAHAKRVTDRTEWESLSPEQRGAKDWE